MTGVAAPRLTLSFDMRAPGFGAAPDELYAAALDQAAWADVVGFDALMLNEHHASPDGYLPSPVVLASAMAARTRRIRLWISALVLPLHDPVRVAEDVAVLDLVSGGRVVLVVAAGYREAEFALFGADFSRRAALVEEGVAVLTRAWSGVSFPHRGTEVRVLPRPLQRPRIPIVLGGSSPGSARRAARVADGYRPSRAALVEVYETELAALGRPAPPVGTTLAGEPAVFVARDVDRFWTDLAPFAVHDTASYAEWTRFQPGVSRHTAEPDADAVRTSGNYLVLTPDECLDRVRNGGGLHLKPLLGGLPPQLSWASLRLLESEVLPHLERRS